MLLFIMLLDIDCHMNINIIIIHWSIRIKKNGKVAPKTSPHSRSIFPLQMTRAAHIHKHTTKASYKIWGYFWNSEKKCLSGLCWAKNILPQNLEEFQLRTPLQNFVFCFLNILFYLWNTNLNIKINVFP